MEMRLPAVASAAAVCASDCAEERLVLQQSREVVEVRNSRTSTAGLDVVAGLVIAAVAVGGPPRA